MSHFDDDVNGVNDVGDAGDVEGSYAPQPGSSGAPEYEPPQAEALIRRTIAVIDAARPMPLSTSSMINKDEVLELLNEAVERMPDELRAARWLLKEREEFLAKVRREGDDIIEMSQTQAARLVERSEVVRSSERRAREIVDAAEGDARRLRLETEDYCDQKLGSFENVLERTMQVVGQGRAKLQRNPMADTASGDLGPAVSDGGLPNPDHEDVGGFFDQDESG